MTPLRQRMLEDMRVRNLAENMQRSYVQQISAFARHFDRSPELLGPKEIRAYQAYLTDERTLSPASVCTVSGGPAISLPRHAQARMGGDRNPPAQETVQAAGHLES
jgi:hypothetical protein